MTLKIRLKPLASVWFMLFFPSVLFAQKPEFNYPAETSERIEPSPESVFEMFRQAGMQPVNHELTSLQKEKVRNAFSLLPPMHQKILEQHLKSISFMDNMPNTALTSLLDSAAGKKKFNITFRAGLLDETISQWATWKENTCFQIADSADYHVRVEAGDMDALVYVLLHEATHVVDAVTEVTPYFAEKDSVIKPTPFVKGIWQVATVPDIQYIDSLLEKTRFRSGKAVPISLAEDIYRKLSDTPFPSLYAMAAWSEDLAELVSVYHMNVRLKQPFNVVVTKGGIELFRFVPMNNALVKRRVKQLSVFYAG